MNQIKATVLSMKAIRSVRPDAQFISTEDGGKTWSTEPLQALCAEREARRWIGLDLLCGRVDRGHALFSFLTENGIAEDEILWFLDNPCPPDVLGLNYYLTSDRFLDHQVWKYPDWMEGGDTGNEPLVDIEAVRIRRDGIHGAGAMLTDAWERYGIPVAITECHLGGGYDGDPVRWLAEVWAEAWQARQAGVDVAAVTVWSLLGSWDWCSLVTSDRGVYEPGIFDVRSGQLAPTALADAVRRIAAGEPVDIAGEGWWHRPERFTFDPVSEHDSGEALEGNARLDAELEYATPFSV